MLIGTAEGVIKSGSLRRLCASQRGEAAIAHAMRAVPWDLVPKLGEESLRADSRIPGEDIVDMKTPDDGPSNTVRTSARKSYHSPRS